MVTVFYKSSLTEKEKIMYDRVLDGIINYEDEIMLDGASKDSIGKIINSISMDRPELFYVDWGMSYEYTSSYVKLLPEYRYKREEAFSELNRIDSTAESLVKQVRGYSKRDAALMLHDVLAKHIEYTNYDSITKDPYTIVGALKNKKCVCEGFARAYKYLCDKSGIPCFMVVGFGRNNIGITESHAWNMVKLDGKCYHVDVTFDSRDKLDYCSRSNFLISDGQMIFNHQPDEEYDIPCCNTSLNPLPEVGTVSEFVTHLRRDCNRDLPFTEYRFKSPVNAKQFFDKYYKTVAYDDEYYDKIENFTHSAGDVIATVGVVWKTA